MGNEQSQSWHYKNIEYIPYYIYNTTDTIEELLNKLDISLNTIPSVYTKNIKTYDDKIQLIIKYNTFIEHINELSLYDNNSFIEYHYDIENKNKYKYKYFFNGIQKYFTFNDLSLLKTYIQDYKSIETYKHDINMYIENHLNYNEIKINNIYNITNLEVLKHYITTKFDLILKYYIDNFTIVFKKKYK